ncbi:hypothetical protein, partial [Allomesorhizobium camelthorni]|uniref:hypothetical protein n=1 Tax=Allomesorhizobium camelthorni TaxID=475069 RepID=UPI00197DDA93
YSAPDDSDFNISRFVGLLETIQHSGARTRHCVARMVLYRMGLLLGKRHSPNPTCFRVIAATAAQGSVLSTWWIVAIVEIAPFFDDNPRFKDSGLCARLPTLEVMQGKTHWSCRLPQKAQAATRTCPPCAELSHRSVRGLRSLGRCKAKRPRPRRGFERFSFKAALSEDRQGIGRFDHELGHGLLLVENGGSTAWSPK